MEFFRGGDWMQVERNYCRTFAAFTNKLVINKYETKNPTWVVSSYEEALESFLCSTVRVLHLLLWKFLIKFIVIHFAVILISLPPFFSSDAMHMKKAHKVASWKFKKFTNYEIMTRSSDNAIEIINWIWTWSHLHVHD